MCTTTYIARGLGWRSG